MVLWKKQFITVRIILLKSQSSAMASPTMTMASVFTALRTPTWPKSGVLASTTMATLTGMMNAPGYTMLHWLTILLENREFDTSAPLAAEAKEYLMNTFHLDYKSADIIIGYRADDSYFSFASDFINGAISYRQLCNAMRLGKLGQQFVLKSKAAFEQLEFLGYETADSKEWYKKKAFRDQTARRQYLDVERNRRQRGDLYITTILDEEMKPDDPRLR